MRLNRNSLFLLATALISSTAQSAWAGFLKTTLNSISVNSVMTGPIGTWTLVESRTITDSRTSDSRSIWGSSSGSSSPAGYGNAIVVWTYQAAKPAYYTSGAIDGLIVRHDLGSSMARSWNASGTVNVTFDSATQFFADSNLGSSWSFGGSAIAQGQRFEAGTYTLNYASSYTMPSGGQTRQWDCVAYFAPAAVPAPGAAALLGAAGLLGRRRRA